ncbi:hypothetical protein DW322_08660 [Rhodococcus rhodnii]|uniref:Uncharacterized protein n=3 Tax=Rhodococcus rhodnii TaxID=38312 RepID=R7WU22_9NOCA|nr:hypothetical protein Rrhod_0973 [Rhodococcus rhodnii LMG 5362]TXG90280.1 hypothetical protein DW322_08660 [Rhodococcus rhodnii]
MKTAPHLIHQVQGLEHHNEGEAMSTTNRIRVLLFSLAAGAAIAAGATTAAAAPAPAEIVTSNDASMGERSTSASEYRGKPSDVVVQGGVITMPSPDNYWTVVGADPVTGAPIWGWVPFGAGVTPAIISGGAR